MKNITIIMLTGFFLLLMASCVRDKNNAEFKITHIKTIECKDIPFSAKKVQSHIDADLSDDCFIYYDKFNLSLGIHFMEANYSNNIPIPLHQLLNKRLSSSDFYAHSIDSLYYFDRDLMGIILFDTSGNVLGKSAIESKYPPNPTISNFFVVSENIHYSWFPESDMSRKDERKYVFSKTSPICNLEFDKPLKGGRYSTYGSYPENYKAGNNYYNFGPDIFIGLNGETIASYEADHSIQIYKNSNLKAEKICKSNYIDKFESISDKEFRDLSYCKTYLGTKPEYTEIIADPYKKRYYRISKLKINPNNTDSINNGHWTIIIMDENFDVKGEALIPLSKYLPDFIMPSRNGLFVKKTPKSKEEFYGDLKLSLIQLTL